MENYRGILSLAAALDKVLGGTAIIWELIPGENSTDLQHTHVGLAPSFECYERCIAGWTQFTYSLKLSVENSEGPPFKT